MATIYVRSIDGNDADNGSTWALAKATVVGAGGIDNAGDIVYISQAHSEFTNGAVAPSWSSTNALPTLIICADDSAQPPTAAATGALVSTGDGTITLGAGYHYGITYECGIGSSIAVSLVASGTMSEFEQCSLRLSTTSGSGAIQSDFPVTYVDCTFKFAASGQAIRVGSRATRIRGGSVLSGGTSPTTLFRGNNAGAFTVDGFDLSNCDPGVDLYTPTSSSTNVDGWFRDCVLPTSWSGALVTNVANLLPRSVIEMFNCRSGSVYYKYRRQMFAGLISDESTIVCSGGASDGTTPFARKMVTNANAKFPSSRLESQDLYVWNDATGSSITATIEIITDNVTLKDDEAYIELSYPSGSSDPLTQGRITDRRAIVGTAANQTSSSVTWTTTGLTTPIKQKLEVSFTPQSAGYITARVVLCKPSTTMYFDPKVTLS